MECIMYFMETFMIPHGKCFLVRVAYGYTLQASFPFFKITLTYTYLSKLPVSYELTHLSIISADASVGADYSTKNTQNILCFQL